MTTAAEKPVEQPRLPTQRATNNRPIFIIGCDRSGTTLLRLMLNAHPRLCVPNESDFITELYDHVSEFGTLQRVEHLDGLLDFLCSIPRYQLWKLDNQLVRQSALNSDRSLAAIIDSVFRCYSDAKNKPRWGDKTPRYTTRVEMLAKLFPDAQFILLARDPRAVHASLKRVDWHPHCPVFNATKWRHYWIKSTHDLKEYFPLNHLVLKYEELVANPAPVLRQVCDFLQEDYDASMLDYHLTASENQPEGLQDHALTTKPVESTPAQRWKHSLSNYEKFVIENITGDLMKGLAYEASPALGRFRRAAFHVRAQVAVRLPDRVRRLIHS